MIYDSNTLDHVEAYTASWIEIIPGPDAGGRWNVEAYTASWIEIPPCNNPRNSVQSRLIQPRGLKYFSVVLFVQSPDVEAYTASWIEISKTMRKMMSVFGRGLYSLVD